MSQPAFWFRKNNPLSLALLPFSWLWRLGNALNRLLWARKTIDLPVISVGNINIGGTGKTPLTIALAQKLIESGQSPHILSRGYKGSLNGPLRVNRYLHLIREVGDEAMLLLEFAPTWIAKNRYEGAHEAKTDGASVILLDDGHQNRHLEPDLSIILVDGTVGFGNKRVIPSGPLREPMASGLARAHCIIIVGGQEGTNPFRKELTTLTSLPIFKANLKPVAQGMQLHQTKVVGFAGIGNPWKFKKTLLQLGVDLVEFIPLNDHQVPSERLLRRIERKAYKHQALIVTTEKDSIRLNSYWKSRILSIPVRMEIENVQELMQLINEVVNPASSSEG